MLPPRREICILEQIFVGKEGGGMEEKRYLVDGLPDDTILMDETSSFMTSRRWALQTDQPSCQPRSRFLHWTVERFGSSRRSDVGGRTSCSSSTMNNAFGQGLGVSRNGARTVPKH